LGGLVAQDLMNDHGPWPAVAVVMPVRNEAAGLRRAVAAVRAQEYPGSVQLCLAVAPSTDGTEAVAAGLAAELDDVLVVANPAGTTPAGLNAAIRATSGDVVVRVDGHAELDAGYLRRAVETLCRTGAANVGGIQRAVGATPFERAVAEAMTSRFGTGDATFHYGGSEGPTDTVYLGVFDRAAIERVGLFDEQLQRNQDYELNIRLRAGGGVVWFDPALSASYRPRGSLRALARQYFDYGRWKRSVVRRHPRSLRWRQAVPPVVAVAVVAGAIGGLAWRRAWLAPASYLLAVATAATLTGTNTDRRIRLLAVFPTMHLSWGVGFLLGEPRRVS
jgi:glycosyltransferase involved in cell wall biosynthesis